MAWLLFYISHKLEMKDVVYLHSLRFRQRTFDGIKKRLSKERTNEGLGLGQGHDGWDREKVKDYLREYITKYTLSGPDPDRGLPGEDQKALQALKPTTEALEESPPWQAIEHGVGD
ncbi:hypothetical protein FGG08_003132 [Glutinoglossum americanum]|uniref:Uncharacterized protein n=1 Tax=Glutinoglossum americanum TaxID=1670608 RepID=A0A9P8L0Y5_9PEZI|nr:hypothetical protein FGG08_003132 [Glutinoglossum americanum]